MLCFPTRGRRLSLFHFVAVAALLAVPLSISCAGDTETGENPSSIEELREGFLAGMRAAMAPAGEKYVDELKKLELAYAKAGKYEAAIATRNEREALERFLAGGGGAGQLATSGAGGGADGGTGEPDPEKPSDEDGIGFTAAAGVHADGAVANEDSLLLEVAGSSANWALGEDFSPGGYEVLISYSSQADAEVQVKESFFRLSATLPDSGGKTQTASLGTLKITSRSDRLTLTHIGESEAEGLTVYSLRLVSTKDQ